MLERLSEAEQVEHYRENRSDWQGKQAPFWTPSEIAELRKMRLGGWQVEAIAARLGRTTAAVETKLRKFGISTRERGDAWSEEDTTLLIQLWAEGLSGTQIGARLKKSRSAVLGRVHRLKLPKRSIESNKTGTALQRPRKRKYVRPTKKPKPIYLNSAIFALNLDLTDLQRHQCRWPVSDEAPHKFCGHLRRDGSFYCDFHHKRSRIQDPKPKTRIPFTFRINAGGTGA